MKSRHKRRLTEKYPLPRSDDVNQLVELREPLQHMGALESQGRS